MFYPSHVSLGFAYRMSNFGSGAPFAALLA